MFFITNLVLKDSTCRTEKGLQTLVLRNPVDFFLSVSTCVSDVVLALGGEGLAVRHS